MAETNKQQEPIDFLNIKKEIESISDQLCYAVSSDFDFVIENSSTEESVQKLSMLVNFVLDSARRAVSDVKEKNVQLTALDKLKTDFMANVSHELRTPLTLILGPLETIIKDSSDTIPKQQHDNLLRMHRNASRLYVLVNNLLDFSKAEAEKYTFHEELLDVNELIGQIVDDTQDLARERKITLKFMPCTDLDLLLFDPNVIEKIILNLTSNALKFTPEGGYVNICLTKQNDLLQISVSDNGLGIPASQISHLFERFHQIDSSLSRSFEGTGIGLTLVNQFVTLMGGKITVESEENKGSKFLISLPMKKSAKDGSINTTSPEKQHHKSHKISLSNLANVQEDIKDPVHQQDQKNLPIILVADDNADMRSFIKSLLENAYNVVEAENGKIALEAIRKYNPHVILSDVMMPVMDGYQLTQTIKSDPDLKHIPIILITAKAGKEAVVSAMDIGADDYLPKPFSSDELLARTRSALRQYKNYTLLRETNNELIKEIEERKRLESINESLNSQLLLSARQAGMADVSTSILHNVGNVLNSVSVSLEILKGYIESSQYVKFIDVCNLLKPNLSSISTYLTEDPKGKFIPQYLINLSEDVGKEYELYTEETNNLRNYVQHVKEIIATQNALSGTSGMTEKVSVPIIVDTALKMTGYDIESNKHIKVNKNYQFDKDVVIDKTKILQILVNLLQNAKEAVMSNDKNEMKEIVISVEEINMSKEFKVEIEDNGVGILPENITKIFSFGFSTKEKGHGFGLHASAISAKEMGGKLIAESEGNGKGAVFTLTLPS